MGTRKKMTQKKNATLGVKLHHKGKPCRRGQPIYYSEVKERIHLCLTATARRLLEEQAVEARCSISEFIERWVRSSMERDTSLLAAEHQQDCENAQNGKK
jgi:hypothetical protein